MVANRTTRRMPAKPVVETEDQKLARLEKELDTAYADRDILEDKIAQLEEEIAAFNPPLIAGDIVKDLMGQRLKVIEVTPAFDSHAVRAVVVDKTNKPKDGKIKLFDASDLEFIEESK